MNAKLSVLYLVRYSAHAQVPSYLLPDPVDSLSFDSYQRTAMTYFVHAVSSLPWRWPYLVAILVVGCVVVPALILWLGYRYMLARIVASVWLIRLICGLRLIGLEMAMLPTCAAIALALSTSSSSPTLRHLLLVSAVGILSHTMILFITFYIQRRAQDRGQWQKRRA